MLTLSKIYAVKTGHPRVNFSPDSYRERLQILDFDTSFSNSD